MADLPSNLSIHELLRYVIPGYSLLFMVILPFVLTDPQLLLISNWELVLSFFVLGGLAVGFSLFYPYYAFFRWFVYNPKKRRSIKKAIKLITNSEPDFNNLDDAILKKALALQSRALIKASNGENPTLFQFSIFHSIGALIPAIIIGYVLSVILGFSSFNLPQIFWAWEGILLVTVIVLNLILIIEFRYRSKLAIELEDQLAEIKLDEILKDSSQDLIEQKS